MKVWQKKNKGNKFELDKSFEDKDGLAPRLSELIRLTRWLVYIGIGVLMIVGATFITIVAQGLVK